MVREGGVRGRGFMERRTRMTPWAIGLVVEWSVMIKMRARSRLADDCLFVSE